LIGPGYSYFITPNIGLEGLVKYDGKQDSEAVDLQTKLLLV
jgi:hypothetical protein